MSRLIICITSITQKNTLFKEVVLAFYFYAIYHGNMAKIVFFETEKWEEEYFTRAFPNDDLHFSPLILEPNHDYEGTLYEAEVLSVFSFDQLPKEVLEKFPNVKHIAIRSTGYDNIDLAYCKEKNIVISNVPAYGVHSVAEHTFALMLALSRKLIPSIERTRKGDFTLDGLRGFELFGKTLGVIGTGNIGSVVAKLGLGIGMKVIAHNRHEDDELKSLGVQFVDLDALLGQSDIVTLHLPYMEATKHTINMENISKFKRGALLINAARGGLVQTQAILEGLEQKILAGAGLDVLEEEYNMREERELLSTKFLDSHDLKTQLMDHILLDQENVIITPHNAFNTNEAVHQILETTVKNIQQFLANAPQNIVSAN